jgi:hypothetical protein
LHSGVACEQAALVALVALGKVAGYGAIPIGPLVSAGPGQAVAVAAPCQPGSQLNPGPNQHLSPGSGLHHLYASSSQQLQPSPLHAYPQQQHQPMFGMGPGFSGGGFHVHPPGQLSHPALALSAQGPADTAHLKLQQLEAQMAELRLSLLHQQQHVPSLPQPSDQEKRLLLLVRPASFETSATFLCLSSSLPPARDKYAMLCCRYSAAAVCTTASPIRATLIPSTFSGTARFLFALPDG